MDLAHLDYILRIAEERSITRAAERLFVTAPALNQQLQKLEGELGTPLFIRNRSDWQLTAAGEVYVQAAREILNIRKDACHRIGELAGLAGRQYRVGLIPERGPAVDRIPPLARGMACGPSSRVSSSLSTEELFSLKRISLK